MNERMKPTAISPVTRSVMQRRHMIVEGHGTGRDRTSNRAGEGLALLRAEHHGIVIYSPVGTRRSRHGPHKILRLAARLTRSLLAVVCACSALSVNAYADDPWEIWPEVSLFVSLSPRTRIYLDATYAGGEESDTQQMDLAAYLDISLLPIMRPSLQKADWQRSRYFWARIGYDQIFKVDSGTRAVYENRGIVSLWGKAELPAEIWLEGRVRADLRLIDGDYSTRYRFRLEATREFTVLDHAVVPYFNVEWFYDTRYDDWARTLYQAGSEVTVNQHFRFELYLARQRDDLPSASSLNGLGVVAKWYY
jgi:hypothetical protein